MDFSYVHIRYFIGYVYHICLQDTIQSTLSLCLRCQAMLLPMPLRPLLLTTRSGFTPSVGYHPCSFCLLAVHDLPAHIRAHCAQAYLATLTVACALWRSTPALRVLQRPQTASHTSAALEIEGGLTICDPVTFTAIGVGADAVAATLCDTAGARRIEVCSLGGLWRTAVYPPDRAAFSVSERVYITHQWMSAADAARPRQQFLPVALTLPLTLAGRPVRWMPTVPHAQPHVLVRSPASAMDVQHSLLLSVVLRSLPWTKLYTFAYPDLPIPPPRTAPPTTPLYVICALGADAVEWRHLQRWAAGTTPCLATLPANWDPTQAMSAWAPVRVVYACPGLQIAC